LKAFGEVDVAHAALAQRFANTVMRKRLADHRDGMIPQSTLSPIDGSPARRPRTRGSGKALNGSLKRNAY
jgi:hypothetical protein